MGLVESKKTKPLCELLPKKKEKPKGTPCMSLSEFGIAYMKKKYRTNKDPLCCGKSMKRMGTRKKYYPKKRKTVLQKLFLCKICGHHSYRDIKRLDKLDTDNESITTSHIPDA